MPVAEREANQREGQLHVISNNHMQVLPKKTIKSMENCQIKIVTIFVIPVPMVHVHG